MDDFGAFDDLVQNVGALDDLVPETEACSAFSFSAFAFSAFAFVLTSFLTCHTLCPPAVTANTKDAILIAMRIFLLNKDMRERAFVSLESLSNMS